MSKKEIKSSIQAIRRKLEAGPRIWKFRGKRVVPVDHWELEDWTTFPDQYHIGFSHWLKPPKDWWHDYLTLLTKLEDPNFGQTICGNCAIKYAQHARKDDARNDWADRGGIEAREKFYATCNPQSAKKFRLQGGMKKTEINLYDAIGANGRSCDIVNYFKCPYPDERDDLTKHGRYAYELWEHVEWYHRHWNGPDSFTPSEEERKWYHWHDPPIIDVTNLDDIEKALDDGRMNKIIEEHKRYMKETGFEIWAL
jgi:hypothetical protein